ncbi:MAG: MotA/TolQ/ExbB proton channel family protein [Treponema sp.]|jgi:chemotaxis protein MotA|nr:MotA/TolQ/ExbB proton channel family protein [Treponema sp.]
MNIGTLVGVAGAFGMLIFTALNTAGMMGLIRLLNLPSFALVIMGSFFSVVITIKMNEVTSVFGAIRRAFQMPTFNEAGIIQKLVAFSEKALREGLLALEEELEDLEDEFMRKGLRLVVDGTDAAIIRDLMELELSQMQSRHSSKMQMLIMWASFSPAYGMMGTVIGLINMLANLEDKSAIGPNMAMALITTLYGSILANTTVLPWSTKLRNQDIQESSVKEMIIEGVLSIQAGDNTRILALKLLAYLDPDTRKVLEKDILKD